MISKLCAALGAILFWLYVANQAAAQIPPDVLVSDLASGETVYQEGDLATRTTPASTFKVPLALMGFDAGILEDPGQPVWPYRDEYQAGRQEIKRDLGPRLWMSLSAVWYSQALTRALGPEAFQKYVDGFNYGNRDLSGDPGRNNGLTRAWLGSSLQISPAEQVAFLRALFQRQLPVSAEAVELTTSIMPSLLTADGWEIWGKTGSGPGCGWYVGLAVKDSRRLVFAVRQRHEGRTATLTAGAQARELLTSSWNVWLATP